MKIRGMALPALWRRGWWVMLMLFISNVVLGTTYAGVAHLLQPFVSEPLPAAAVLVLVTIGPLFLGWLFEEFALTRPRLRRDLGTRDGAV
jgi:hypothetical protein